EPGAKAAIAVAQGKTIGVIATEATVQSGAYSKAIASMDHQVRVIERACPLFVSLAEEGWANTDVARAVARDYLAGFQNESPATLVLGCTHYPILREVISETVGSSVKLIDSGEAAAAEVSTILRASQLAQAEHEWLNERELCDDLDHFYVTDAAERFARVAERFLGSAPSILEAGVIWGHDEVRPY